MGYAGARPPDGIPPCTTLSGLVEFVWKDKGDVRERVCGNCSVPEGGIAGLNGAG